jgi:hypothetical protein
MLAAVVWLCACALACGRHVVLDPGEVVRSNDPDWRVLREPNADGGAAPPAPTK